MYLRYLVVSSYYCEQITSKKVSAKNMHVLCTLQRKQLFLHHIACISV